MRALELNICIYLTMIIRDEWPRLKDMSSVKFLTEICFAKRASKRHLEGCAFVQNLGT